MKRNRFGMKRGTAVLLCFMLVLGSAGTPAYAGEPVQDGAEEAYDTGVLVPATEDAADEVPEEDGESGKGNLSDEEMDTDEGSGDPSFDGGSGELPDAVQENAQSADAADDEDASQGQDEQPAGAEEKEGEESVDAASGESVDAASEESGTLIEEPLSDDETAATDNAAASGNSVGVYYLKRSWDGTKVVTSEELQDEAKPVPSDGSMTRGWYYLGSDVTVDGRIESIEGDVNLILEDGKTLDVKGLYVPEGITLTIYARSDGDNAGRIYSHPGKSQGGAGIGGYSGHDNGNIVIHSGTVEAEGYDHCAGIGSNDGREGGDITIYGGTVTAKGGSDGAGIGGGRNCDGGTITIYGGTVNANDENCNENGAGIGGGNSGSGGEITINGGTITTYSRDGAGIGGGDDGDGGTITINGGTVTANKVNQGQGARIGGGCDAGGGTITINGGTITAYSGKGAGIGGGKGCSGGTVNIGGGVINVSGSCGIGNGEEGSDVSITLDYTNKTKDTISITAPFYDGTVTLNKPFAKYTGSDGQELANAFSAGVITDNMLLEGGALKAWDGQTQSDIKYTKYSWNKEARKLETETVTPAAYEVLKSDMQELTSGTYVVSKNMTIDHYISVRKGAAVDLVVPKGVTLTCKKGIGCGYDEDGNYATLNIFGEGTVIANGKGDAAGIGGPNDETSGNITIHGTTVNATGGKHGAGIGGGDGGKDPDEKTSIKIYAGTVTATGGIDGAGIGGGDGQPGARTYIYSGTITARSEKHGAGIGGGDEEGTLGIFIYGGWVKATGGGHGAGIGAGEHGGNLRKAENGGGINIYGGDVTAYGGSGGAGIGGGYDEDMSGTIEITGDDTKLTVSGGSSAAGIGAGSGAGWVPNGDMDGTVTIDCGKASNITIDAGYRDTSFNDFGGAGIGAGYGGNMNGKFYFRGGNVVVHSHAGGAGIGGGYEDGNYGGEGGTAYIGGGNLKVSVITAFSDGAAIGAGYNDMVDGTVYIAHDNNNTGKYLRVDYQDDIGLGHWHTVKASERTDYCHKNNTIEVTECNHKSRGGENGLTYTIGAQTHRKKCKYCGLDVTEAHSGADCECGYHSDTCTITLKDDAGLETFKVARGKDFELPDFEGEVKYGTTIPPVIYRVIGWTLEGDTSEKIYEQGDFVTADRDMTFTSSPEHLYQITFDEVPHGSIRAELTDSRTYAANYETLSFGVTADPGYSVGDVTYQIMQGYEIGDKGDVIYRYSDPVKIEPDGDKYRLEMPELTPADGAENNQIIITAETIQNTEFSVLIPEDLTGGTVTADPTTAAEGTPVTLTVTDDPGYHLESIRCRTAGGEDVELTQAGKTGQYTFAMPAEDVQVTAEWETVLPEVIIKGVTGSFNDRIKLNYYLNIPEEVLEDEKAYVTIKNESTGKTDTLPVKNAPFNREKGGYRFSTELVAKEASDTITAKAYDGNDNEIALIGGSSGKDYTGTGAQYSLMRYFDWLEKEVKDDNEKKIGTAARDYCAAAQIYFKYHADGLKVSSAVDAVTEETLSSYIAGREGTLPEGVSIAGISAMLESDNTLRLYFDFKDVEPSSLKFAIDGIEAELKERSDGRRYIALDAGVFSNRLQDAHTYTVSTGDVPDSANSYTITASVLTYARSCANKKGTTKAIKNTRNLGKALYLYNRAAVAAFGE